MSSVFIILEPRLLHKEHRLDLFSHSIALWLSYVG